MKNPRTPAEWRKAVDAASWALALDDARQYGIVTDGPEIDVERCEEILRKGKAKGLIPQAEAFEMFSYRMAMNFGRNSDTR